MFHGVDMQRVLEVESSALHRLTKPQIYKAAEKCHEEWSKQARKSTLPRAHNAMRAWLAQNKADQW